MSVNITYKPLTNEQKWNSLQNGSFAIVEGNQEHPIPNGLYRIFIMRDEEVVPTEPGESPIVSYILVPMFDGPFVDGMYPYMLPISNTMPPLLHKINQILIDVDVVV
jgi:hypothetical protein